MPQDMPKDLELKIELEEVKSDIRICKKMIEHMHDCLKKVINDNYKRENKPIVTNFESKSENEIWKLYIQADRENTGTKDLNWNLSKLQEYQIELIDLYEIKMSILEKLND